MADDLGIHTRQRVVTQLLTAEGSSPLEIHTRLRSVYCEDAIDVSSVTRWVLFLRAVRRAEVTSPAATDQPRWRHGDERQG